MTRSGTIETRFLFRLISNRTRRTPHPMGASTAGCTATPHRYAHYFATVKVSLVERAILRIDQTTSASMCSWASGDFVWNSTPMMQMLGVPLFEEVNLITQGTSQPEVANFDKQFQLFAQWPDTDGGRPPKGLVGLCLGLVIAFLLSSRIFLGRMEMILAAWSNR